MKELFDGTGNGIKIAIIDSGVEQGHPQLKNYRFQGVEIRETEEGLVFEEGSFEDSIGHGTAVTFQIKKAVPESEVYIIKIFDHEDESASLDKLYAAMSFAIEKVKPDILHLSNGIVECEDIAVLKQLCKKAADMGIILVAAYDNMGSISYPAAFECVIGVDWYPECTRVYDYIYVDDPALNILGYGLGQKLPWIKSGYRTVSGSSFVAPIITGYVAVLMEKGYRTADEIKDKLKEYASQVRSITSAQKIPGSHKITRAVAFPFNKEIQAIARLEDLLEFEIDGYYEYKSSRNVGKKISELLACNNTKIVNNYKNIDWSGDFDTVILGHLKKMCYYSGIDFTAEILTLCLKWKKNIYAFDELSKYQELVNQMLEEGLSVYTPDFKKSNLPGNPRGKLRRFGKPVLCIAGTSSKQGKFTLQLELRRNLMNRGYKVGQLGTEPSSLLFGMDEILPVGYGSEYMDLRPENIISAINMLIGNIEDKNPDIILLGLQSHVLPYAMGNLQFYPVHTQNILFGSEPDGVILCINTDDEIEYVRRTINYLESVIETKVICLVISPLSSQIRHTVFGTKTVIIEEEEVSRIKRLFSDKLGLPVFEMKNKIHVDDIVNEIENFFTADE